MYLKHDMIVLGKHRDSNILVTFANPYEEKDSFQNMNSIGKILQVSRSLKLTFSSPFTKFCNRESIKTKKRANCHL